MQILDASQLFGSYTFGREWGNGYDALATLDINGDGKISGAELKDLALWFDANRNGISEPGEVKNISSTDIVELYFSASQKVANAIGSHDLVLQQGYKIRSKQGQTSYGKSIDWMSYGLDDFNAKVKSDLCLKSS